LTTETKEIVRVKVRGASCAVNAIQDQKTDRGLSLICPFPALEVDIPISFSTNGEEEMQMGTIHRISVEDDAVTSLPKLRLSIRAKETRSTVISPTPQCLIHESRESKEAPADSADRENSPDMDCDEDDLFINALISAGEDHGDIRDSRFEPDEKEVIKKEVIKNEFRFAEDFDHDTLDDDPAWVDCQDLPLPGDMLNHARANRHRKITSAVAWVLVMGLLGIGGYLLMKSGLIDTSKLKEYAAALTLDDNNRAPLTQARANPPKTTPYQMVPPVVIKDSPKSMIAQIGPADPPSIGQISDEPPTPAPVTQAVAPKLDPSAEKQAAADAMVKKVSTASPVLPTPIDAKDEVFNQEAPSVPADTLPKETSADDTEYEEVVLVLPTRWPVEYASAYRLRDPKGVVVDVPGGLVKNEGWLDLHMEHPMIRSVKAIQRETGARFMILINGKTPRFMTHPKTGGVAVRLFRKPENAEKPSQIALLNQ
jgi:hypothetical protein